jgi:enolase-phosphatase E1
MVTMLHWVISLIALPVFAYQAILTDIEGTTTSISFVHDVLFPYAKERVREFVLKNRDDVAVAQIIDEVKKMALPPQAGIDEVIATFQQWMEEDRKITPLKSLQGMMWKEGYEKGEFLGHVYPDAWEQLMLWKKEGISLYVYSSGSKPSQKLLFGHTGYGDLTSLFSGYFDTKMGGKKEASSYRAIAKQLGLEPQEILFLSDSLDELNAARSAGMGTILLCREGSLPMNPPHPAVSTFNEIDPRHTVP